jgi:hypothetical protein
MADHAGSGNDFSAAYVLGGRSGADLLENRQQIRHAACLGEPSREDDQRINQGMPLDSALPTPYLAVGCVPHVMGLTRWVGSVS